MMITKRVLLTVSVEVTVDETKFDKEFMQEFRDSFWAFHTIEEHIEHLGQMAIRGIAEDDAFIEGYGESKEMGITFDNVQHEETEVEDV